MMRICCLLLCFAFAKALFAQQDSQYTQYIYNPSLINPAYAGSRESLSILALYRAQWVGLDGAPETSMLTVHSPVGDRGVGLGLSIFTDAIGPARESFSAADFSYSLEFDSDSRLNFGIKAGFHLLDVDFNRTNIFDRTDPELTENINNRIAPTLGLGFYYYTDRWYVGLSTPNVLQTDHFEEANVSSQGSFVAEEEIHFYGIGGSIFSISKAIDFKPAVMVKYIVDTPLQVDLTANFLIYDRFTLGAAYRWDAAVSGLMAYQLNNNFMLGLAYDREITQLGNTTFNSGSYEVFLRYEIFKNPRVMNSPRFF